MTKTVSLIRIPSHEPNLHDLFTMNSVLTDVSNASFERWTLPDGVSMSNGKIVDQRGNVGLIVPYGAMRPGGVPAVAFSYRDPIPLVRAEE